MKLAIIPNDLSKNSIKNGIFSEYPMKYIQDINGVQDTITIDLLDGRKDKQEFLILSLLQIPWCAGLKYYKHMYNILRKYKKNKKVLMVLEPSIISPLVHSKIFHKFFNYVFTRNDSIIDNIKYIKSIGATALRGGKIKKIEFENKKFLTLINGNKQSFFPNELYSWREKAIRYYENNYINDFDLYGVGWDKPNVRQKIFGFNKYPSYKGCLDDKLSVLSQYKFNICFENRKNVKGYITEKVLDAFYARSVPVYRGADNITEYIPSECFIDFRKFMDFDKLTKYLIGMRKEEYDKYIKNIEKFINNNEKDKKQILWFDEGYAKYFLSQLEKCI